MEQYKTVPKITEKSSPPVPLKTYRWEDIRREKKRGKYPYTYLYKGPFFEKNAMEEDKDKPVNGEKKKKIVKKIKKVPKKKSSEDADDKMETITKEEPKIEAMEVELETKEEMVDIKTEAKIYSKRNDSPTGDWLAEDTKEETINSKNEDIKEEETKEVIVAARNDSPVDWWNEDTKEETLEQSMDKEENKNSSGDDIKPDPISKSDSRTPTSDDTYTESNIEQYLDKEEVSKSVSDASGAGNTSASEAELPQDLKPTTTQHLDIGDKRKHSDPSDMTKSNLSLFEKMKNSKFKPPTFKIPKFKRFNFSKKPSKRLKTDTKETPTVEIAPQHKDKSESPVYIRIPLIPTAEELEIERQETRRRLTDGSNRLNTVDTNGNISSSSSRPSPEKSETKTSGYKKSGVKSTKKISPKTSPKTSPLLTKTKDSPEYIFIPLKGPLPEDSTVEEKLDFTLQTNVEESNIQNAPKVTTRTSPKTSPRGTLKSSPRSSPKGAIKKKAKLKESTTKITKDIKKMATKLKEVQDKTKKSFTTRKSSIKEDKSTKPEEKSTITNDGPVDYIFIPLTGPLPENLVKKSTENLNTKEIEDSTKEESVIDNTDDKEEKVELEKPKSRSTTDVSEGRRDSLMSKLKGSKSKVEKKEILYKLEQTPKSLEILITKRSGDSPPVEYIHIPLTPTEEELEKEFLKTKELQESKQEVAEPENPTMEKSGTEILKDTSKLVSTPLLLALELPKIKPQKSVKIKEEPKEGFISKLKVLTTTKLESVITPPVIEETTKKFKGFTYSIKRKLEKEEPKLELTDKSLDSLIQQREESPPIDYYQIPVRPTAAELERLAEASKEEPWETEEGFEIIPADDTIKPEDKQDDDIGTKKIETVNEEENILSAKDIKETKPEALEEEIIKTTEKEPLKQIEESSTIVDDTPIIEEKKEEPSKPKVKLQKQKSQAPAIPKQEPKTPEEQTSSNDSPLKEPTEIEATIKLKEEPASLTSIVKEIIPKTTTEVVLLKEIPSPVKIESSKSSPSSPTTPKPQQFLEEPKTVKPLKLTEFTKSTSSLLGPVKDETITKFKGFTSSIKKKLGKEEPKLEHKLTDKSLDSLVGKRETTPPIDYYAIPVRPTAAELERLAQQSKEEPWETEEGFEVITAEECTEPIENPLTQTGEETTEKPEPMVISSEEIIPPEPSLEETTTENDKTPAVLTTSEDTPKKKISVMEKLKSAKPDLKLSMKKKVPKKSSPTGEKKVKRSPPVDKRRRDSPVEYQFIPLNPTKEELAAEKEKQIQKRLDEPEIPIPAPKEDTEPPKVVAAVKKGAVKKQPGDKNKLQDTTAKLTQDLKKFAAKLKDMQKKAKKPTFKTFKHGTKVGSKTLSPPSAKKSISEGKRSPPKSQQSMESPEYIFIPLKGPIPPKSEESKQPDTPALIQTSTTEHSLSKTSPEELKTPEKLVRRKSRPTTKEISATAIDSLKKTKDFSITKLKALKDVVQPPKKPETAEIIAKTEIVKQGSIESPEYIIIPLKDPENQTKNEDTSETKEEELESIFFEKMKIDDAPLKPKKKKRVPRPPLSKEDSVRSEAEPIEEIIVAKPTKLIINEDTLLRSKQIEVIELPVSKQATQVQKEEIIHENLPVEVQKEEIVTKNLPVEIQKEEIITKSLPVEVQKEEIVTKSLPVVVQKEEIAKNLPVEEKEVELHHYEPISKEDEEDGLKTAVLASKVQEESIKSSPKPEEAPVSKTSQKKKKKGLRTPSEDDGVIYETIQVQGEPSPSVQKSIAVTKSVSVEDDDKWSKSIDHEYEPINPPPEPSAPVPSLLQSKPQIDLKDHKPPVEPQPTEPRLLRIPLDKELIQAPEDQEIQSSIQSLNEGHSTPDIQSRPSYMNTPDLSSRTDGVNTSQVDSSALEKLPLKKEARTKQVKVEDVEDVEEAPSMQSKIKTQAGKLKTKFKSIKKPTFTIPNPKFSPKFRRPKLGPKTQTSKFQKLKLQRPTFDTSKFKMPDAPKFTMPQMPQMPQMPKMPTFARMRRQSAPATEEKQTTTGSSIESKPNIFDFRTYPRLFDKTKKKLSRTATMSATTDESTPEFATAPRAIARKKGPVGARWVHRFSDIQFADDEKPGPGDDLQSKDRGDSLERRMEADLRYEEALAEDEEFRDYERENQELNRRSHPGPDGEYPERWRHGSFHNPDSFDEELHNGIDERNRMGYEIQEQNRREEMRRQHLDEHSSVASSGHHRGVLEEIDSDQFFLREKGISQDNIQVGLYLSSEIRDAFRQPVNSLAMHRDYDASDLSLTRPNRPKRKHFKKAKKPKQTPHASQEEMYDEESINTEPEEYPKNLNDFKTYPPPRPKRTKRSRSQTEINNLDTENFQSQEEIPHILGYVDKDLDMDEYNKYISDEALMYENEVMKDIKQPEIVISDQKYEISKREIDRYLQETGMVDTPKPPTRRHRSLKSLAMSDHDSIIGEFNRDKVLQDMLEQELNVYRVEHLPVQDSPLAPARRSRSRTLSQMDDDRTSHGAESLRSECQESPCMEDRRDSMGYAIIDKKKLQEPPLPKRRRSTKSNKSETKFFTVPRLLNDTPTRPIRNYSTLGEPKRSETDLTDEDEKENIDMSQYIEIEDDDHSKNLHSGEVINKMKGRPLPAPPRPPRSRRDRSKDTLKDITQGSNIRDQIDEEKLSIASPGEAIEEIDMSTQTDPLPEDFCCDEVVEEPTDIIVAPTRRKRSSQRDSSLDSKTPPQFRTPIDSPVPRRKLRSRDSSRNQLERSLSPTERRKLRSRDTSFSRSLDRPKTPSDLSRTPIERSLSPTERRRLKSRDSSFSRSLDRPKTPIEGSTSPNAMVIQRQVQTPIEDETVTHASLLVRPVAEYPPDSFVSKRFAADISFDMLEQTVLRKAKADSMQLKEELREAERLEEARRELELEEMRRAIEISDENLEIAGIEEPTSEYFETDQLTEEVKPKVMLNEEITQDKLAQFIPEATGPAKPAKKDKSPDYSEIIKERTDELTEMPEKPQRRRSSATVKTELPQTKIEIPQPEIIERIIERQIPVVPGPETEVEVLKAQRLQVTDLDVERLTVSELQAHKILVSEIDGVSLTINELSSKSGNLVLNGLEIPSGLIQEILDRLQPTPSTSERPPSEQVATQTSLDEPTEHEIFTDPIRTEICTQTSLDAQDPPTPMEQVATQTSLDEPDDSKVPEEFQQLKEPVILIDTSTETDQDDQQEILENLKYRIRFIEEELNDLSTDITQEEINALRLEINDIIEIASEQVMGEMAFRDDDDSLDFIQLPGLIMETESPIEHEILIDANMLRSVPVDELEDMLIRTLSGDARLLQGEEVMEAEDLNVIRGGEVAEVTRLVLEDSHIGVADGRIGGEATFIGEIQEELTTGDLRGFSDSLVPKEFLQLKTEQEQLIESYQPKEATETIPDAIVLPQTQEVPQPKHTPTVPESIQTIPQDIQVPEELHVLQSKEQTKQIIELKTLQQEIPQTGPDSIEIQQPSRPKSPTAPPSRPPLPESLIPQPELLQGIPYPVSYYPEYVRSVPPQSFYTLRSPQRDLSEDDIPIHHRRRRHHRHQSRSSSDDDKRTISRRHTARSPDPSIPQLSTQLARACSHSLGRYLRQLVNQISELLGGPREGKRDLQIALVILLVLVAGLVLLGFGGNKTIHLHHWEFFNPPKEL